MKISILSVCLLVVLRMAPVMGQDNDISIISSQYDESNAVLAPDGKSLYFTVANHVLNKGGRKDPGDIWYSQVDDDGNWSQPIRLQGPVNNTSANRVLGFSSDGLMMYLHDHYKADGTHASSQGISVSRWNGRLWGTPLNLEIPYFKNNSKYQSGNISEDGEVIVLSIESYNTIGNEDIYVSFKRNGGYSEPLNVGPTINSSYQEFTPYLSHDKTVLFFSTNGREGEGSSDVYFSKRLDDSWKNWTEPQNIGKWINSEGKDWNFLMVDKIRKILYISLRNSDGYGDIRILSPKGDIDTLFSDNAVEFIPTQEITKTTMPLSGYVMDQIGIPISNALVKLETEGEVAEDRTDEDGRFEFLIDENKSYSLHVEAGFYIPQLRQFQTEKPLFAKEMNFRLLFAEVGVTVNLKNVLFKKATTNMLPGSEIDLDLVVEMMEANKRIEIQLGGHTDNNGNSKKNLKLSKQRVKTVKKYLVGKGIQASRIEGKGFGDTKPIASNASEATRMLNRRVEFTIIKN